MSRRIDGVEKVDGRFLLELQARTDAVGRIHQQADAQRQIALAVEEENALRLAVVGDAEIALVQRGDDLVLLS